MQIVLREALGPARMFGFAQLAEGIAVQIPDFHDVFSSLFLLQQLQQFLWFHGQDRSVCRAGDRLGPIILISENENVKLQDCSHVAFPSISCQSAPLSDIHFHRV